ncbi:hypothetical protein TrLO_g9467 [Triparma laevis f. longispina]|uniref:Uncharacterized protein n=1 Tax=Triparma laevis f. longispina TaxID=1714387 RepID=A0A9W7EH98_9STRA|nr:hypothetical protein TrLO_g9467 [Triparma laevis f. longispina]
MLLRFIYAALVLLSALNGCAPLSLNLLRPLTARFSATANSIDRDLQPAEHQLSTALIRNHFHPTRHPLDSFEIDTLISSLITSPPPFSPSYLSNKKLYLSLYTIGPKPLWKPSSSNLAGQEYSDKTVINYSEINGPEFYLSALGNYTPNPTTTPTSCPLDYTVSVKSAEIGLTLDPRLTPLKLKLPISGTGKLRVLYASSSLRILTTPSSTKGKGLPFGLDKWLKWEGERTTVVQVCEERVFEGSSGGKVYRAGYRI